MLKGLFSLLITGILFNPAVFFGGLIGILAYIKLSIEQLEILCLTPYLYALFFLLMFLYIYIFKKTLKDDCVHIDKVATFKNIFKHFLLMTFSFYMGILTASYFDFSMPEPKPQVDPFAQYSEALQLQKKLNAPQNNYYNMLNNKK